MATRPINPFRLLARLAPAGALVLAGCAATAPKVALLPDRFPVGRDLNGDACVANRAWNDARLGSAFDVAYSIGCGGVAASRPFASITAVKPANAKPEDEAACGAAAAVTIAGIGPAQARRCFDKALGAPVVVVRFDRGGRSWRGASIGSVTAPMERALAVMTGIAAVGDKPLLDRPASIKPDTLAAAPASPVAAGYDISFDPAIALREGTVLNRQGLYVEASRVLNDALSRLLANTPPGVSAELALEAGLADSNIRFFDAAADHFAQATTILKANPSIDRAAFLERKRTTYRALNFLNRRDWGAALAALQIKPAASPLEDPAMIADLNQIPEGNRDASNAVAGPNPAQLSQLVLDAQRYWAASVALLAQGGPGSVDASQTTLARATANLSALLANRIDPSSVLWLMAQIERQSGRLEAHRADASTGPARDAGMQVAVGRFDCALAALQGGKPTTEQGCAIPLTPESRARVVAAGGQSSGPVVAETQFERASLRNHAGVDVEQVLADYDSAIDALIASSRMGAEAPSGYDTYLDLLAARAQAGRYPLAAERFFRAVQAIGEPAIARQMSQLQQVVSAGSGSAGLVREQADLNRDIAALRYAIASDATDAAQKPDLDKQRQEKEQRLIAVSDELDKNGKLRQIDDHPATIAEVQAALVPGEVYFKLSELRGKDYGTVIGKDQATVFAVEHGARDMGDLAKLVRASIRDQSGKLPFFNVAGGYALWKLISGPAEAQLLAAKSIVVDPAGPLSELPAGVLVTDADSVKAYAASRAADPYDFSKVKFLAGQADLAVALSPRSFLTSRALAASAAAHPFIGFGQHAPPVDMAALKAEGTVSLGLGCPVELTQLAEVSGDNIPISAEKITVAADALGVPDAPRMIGPAFTDTAVEARTDLDQYQVLHFATHGLPETQYGCTRIPPSLLTTIGTNGSDGFLSFREIAGLKLDANLVVLSACDTSASASRATARRSGQEESGRSLDGLVRAFLAANARAVLATYWKVSIEGESDELFRTFYSHGRDESIGDALRTAQLDLMQQPRFSHPYYWGAYFVVGDASKRMVEGKALTASR